MAFVKVLRIARQRGKQMSVSDSRDSPYRIHHAKLQCLASQVHVQGTTGAFFGARRAAWITYSTGTEGETSATGWAVLRAFLGPSPWRPSEP